MSQHEEYPFSAEVLGIFKRLREAKTKEERNELTVALAAQFAKEHDPSDFSATDDFHVYFEEFARAKLAFDQAAARLGRLAANCIEQYHDQQPPEAVEALQAAARTSVN